MQLPIVTSQPLDAIMTGGQTVRLNVTASGAPPLSYQWLKDGFELSNENQSWFSLHAASRADSGVYSARVTNPGGSVLSRNAQVRVRMPQQLGSPTWLSGGSLMFLSNDTDGNPLPPDILNYVEVQFSEDLDIWRTWTNNLVFTNGSLWLIDFTPTQHPKRFYRLLERWGKMIPARWKRLSGDAQKYGGVAQVSNRCHYPHSRSGIASAVPAWRIFFKPQRGPQRGLKLWHILPQMRSGLYLFIISS